MNNQLLKEYIQTVLDEKAFKRNPKEEESSGKAKKEKGFWQKLKSFFVGEDEPLKITEDWIEDQELNYDFEFNDKTKQQIAQFVSAKYDLALRKGKGDKERAESIMRRALDTKYRGFLRQIQAQADSEFNRAMQDDEDE
jgi:hypothetical protein